MAIAGRVLIVPKGDYAEATVYNQLDLVTYNSKPWLCKKNNTVGKEPSAENSAYWQLLIDVSIADADTLDGHHADYFATADAIGEAFETIEVTLPVESWTGSSAPYAQVITVEEMKATSSPLAFFIDDGTNESDSKLKQKAYACFTYFDTAEGSITVTCKYKKPEATFTIGLKGVM